MNKATTVERLEKLIELVIEVIPDESFDFDIWRDYDASHTEQHTDFNKSNHCVLINFGLVVIVIAKHHQSIFLSDAKKLTYCFPLVNDWYSDNRRIF